MSYVIYSYNPQTKENYRRKPWHSMLGAKNDLIISRKYEPHMYHWIGRD